MAADLNEEVAQLRAIFNEAVIDAKQQQSVVLAKLQSKYLGGEDSESPVRVQVSERAFLFTTHESEPKELSPGQHMLSKLIVGEKKHGINSSKAELHTFACVCSIRNHPIIATISLPDYEYLCKFGDYKGALGEASDPLVSAPDVERAVASVGIRSSDGFLGTARLQIELSPRDPRLLIAALQDTYETITDKDGKEKSVTKLEAFEEDFRKEIAHKNSEGGTVKTPVLRSGMLGRILDSIKGKHKLIDGKLLEPTKTITIADLYPLIQFELMRVVATAVRQYKVDDLYDDIETREKIAQDIKNHMGQTFMAFGIELSRVSAFQFRSDKYQVKLEKQEEVALEGALTDDQQKLSEIDKRKRKIEAEDEIDELHKQGEVSRVQGDERLLEDEQGQKLKDQEHEAELKRQAMSKKQEQGDQISDADTDAEVKRRQIDTARDAFSLYKEVVGFKADQDAQRMKLLAELPAEKLLPILIDQNPALEHAFVAAKKAESAEERMAAERAFRNEIVKVHGDNRDRTTALLLEAAKQIGHVTAQHVKSGGDEPKNKKKHVRNEAEDNQA